MRSRGSMRVYSTVGLLSLLVLASGMSEAQNIVSARAGVLNFSEGDVFIGDTPVAQKFGTFPEVKEGADLRTEQGRAEILLTPGVTLRLGEQSAIRMDSTMLVDARLDFLRGSGMVEVVDKPNGTSLTIAYKAYRVRFVAQGVFRFDSSTEEFRALEGQAEVSLRGEKQVVTKGHVASLSGTLVTETFRPSLGDGLYEWSQRRSDQMAQANTPADPADAIGSLGGLPSLPSGSWVTSPFSGTSTYVPTYDALLSQLGVGYASLYSPYGFYGGISSPLYLRLGSSYYSHIPPGHVTHGSYIYSPTPVYRSPAYTGFGRASHPVAGMPAGSVGRAPVVAPPARGVAGHR